VEMMNMNTEDETPEKLTDAYRHLPLDEDFEKIMAEIVCRRKKKLLEAVEKLAWDEKLQKFYEIEFEDVKKLIEEEL
jgi:primosomal protein N''